MKDEEKVLALITALAIRGYTTNLALCGLLEKRGIIKESDLEAQKMRAHGGMVAQFIAENLPNNTEGAAWLHSTVEALGELADLEEFQRLIRGDIGGEVDEGP